MFFILIENGLISVYKQPLINYGITLWYKIYIVPDQLIQ